MKCDVQNQKDLYANWCPDETQIIVTSLQNGVLIYFTNFDDSKLQIGKGY